MLRSEALRTLHNSAQESMRQDRYLFAKRASGIVPRHARTARVVERRQRTKDVRAGLLFQITQRLHFGCFRAFLQRLNKVNYLRWHSLLFGCNVSE